MKHHKVTKLKLQSLIKLMMARNVLKENETEEVAMIETINLLNKKVRRHFRRWLKMKMINSSLTVKLSKKNLNSTQIYIKMDLTNRI